MTDLKSLFEESSKSRGVFRAQASIYHGAFMWINLTAHYFRNKISTIIIRVPKWAFVFLQRNTKFHSCTQTAIRFLQWNTKCYSCTQTAIRLSQQNREFWKLYPNDHLYSSQEIYEIYLSSIKFPFLKTEKKFKI